MKKSIEYELKLIVELKGYKDYNIGIETRFAGLKHYNISVKEKIGYSKKDDFRSETEIKYYLKTLL